LEEVSVNCQVPAVSCARILKNIFRDTSGVFLPSGRCFRPDGDSRSVERWRMMGQEALKIIKKFPRLSKNLPKNFKSVFLWLFGD